MLMQLIITILGQLLVLNEATLLENVKTRYFKDKIYVSIYIALLFYLFPYTAFILF